jgi:hypothetical protein
VEAGVVEGGGGGRRGWWRRGWWRRGFGRHTGRNLHSDGHGHHGQHESVRDTQADRAVTNAQLCDLREVAAVETPPYEEAWRYDELGLGLLDDGNSLAL